MRRIIIFLAVVTIFAMIGCKSGNQTPKVTEEENQTQEEKNVVYCKFYDKEGVDSDQSFELPLFDNIEDALNNRQEIKIDIERYSTLMFEGSKYRFLNFKDPFGEYIFFSKHKVIGERDFLTDLKGIKDNLVAFVFIRKDYSEPLQYTVVKIY